MRLLIVEDDARLASGLARNLEAEGHAVDVAARAEDALRAASQGHFDLVILDLARPRSGAAEVLRRLRAAERPVAVLALAARALPADQVHGADDFMVKPIAMSELAARVRALLMRRAQQQPQPRIVHGPLTLDTRTRRAFLHAEPLELAAREWAVLEVLLGRVERVVSKEAIIRAVAGWGDELSPNAVEVYVSRLRAKLDPAGIRIRTLRGFGYVLEKFKPAAH